MIMLVNISIGDAIDKLTILEIKKSKINNISQLSNITNEYQYLKEKTESLLINPEINILYQELQQINQKLWDIEDQIREKEKQSNFDHEFIALARSVYFTNDKRANIKKQINIVSQSTFTEEKLYSNY